MRDAAVGDAPMRDAAVVACVMGGCDDGNVCTDDTCVPATGCTHTPNAATCVDGVLCNGDDTCGGGTCSVHDHRDPCPGASTCSAATDMCTGCAGASDCPLPMVGEWSACEFAAGDVCVTTGNHTRTRTTYACATGACNATMVVESEPCTRTTVGVPCGTPTATSWSACEYTDLCAETGMMSRMVTTSTCSAGGTCAPDTTTEFMNCNRMTTGTTCGATIAGSFGPCVSSTSCGTTGTQSRSVSTLTCQSSVCTSGIMDESQACTLPSTEGSPCGPPSCGVFGPCVPNTTNTCETMGTQTAVCTTALCAAGACSGTSTTMQTQACTVPRGAACMTRACGPCFEPGMTRCRTGHTAERTCVSTTGTCTMGGFCVGTTTTMTESCTCPG